MEYITQTAELSC